MAKKNKTRKQKIIAEVNRRNQLSSQFTYTFDPKVGKADNSEKKSGSEELSSIKKDLSKDGLSDLQTKNYLIHDLKKTSYITAAIIVLQFFLKFLLNYF